MGTFNGTDSNEVLIGSTDADILSGFGGDDELYGQGGDDSLIGGDGDDRLNGDQGADTLNGGDGDDRLYSYYSEGPDTLDGGAGNDFAFLDFSNQSTSQTADFSSIDGVNLSDGTVVRNIERVVFYSGSGNDSITGLAGDDQLYGDAGNDRLSGGDGNDTIDGNQGSDTLHGGDGDDQLYSVNNEGPDTLDGGAGSDLAFFERSRLTTSQTINFSTASSNDGVNLSDGTVVRNVERVVFYSGSGNDTITGGTGDDYLSGQSGNDSLSGGEGNDELSGDQGADTLEGAAGNDQIFADNADLVSYAGSRANFHVQQQQDGSILVTDLRAGQPEGVDTVYNAAAFRFGSQTYTLAQLLSNAAPVTSPLSEDRTGSEDTPLSGQLLAGSDPDGDGLTYEAVGTAVGGSISIDASGAYTFTPTADFNGSASFQYRVSDGSLTSAPKTVTLTVAPGNEAPIVTTEIGVQSVSLNKFDFAFDASQNFADPDAASGEQLQFSLEGDFARFLSIEPNTGIINGDILTPFLLDIDTAFNTFDPAVCGGDAACEIFYQQERSKAIEEVYSNYYNTSVKVIATDASGATAISLLGFDFPPLSGGRIIPVGTGFFPTIQSAIDHAAPGDTILVAPGAYSENLTITTSGLTLLSSGGRDSTFITGTQNGSALGTLVLAPGVDDVRIGALGQGFTITGIDGISPGIEAAAIYLQGNHDGLVIQGNDVVAKGDGGLSSEFSGAVTDLVVDHNIFSGQSFTGTQPGGLGFGQQFSADNVPRQLVVLGNGGGSGPSASSNIQFTHNAISGTTGGISAVDNTSEQGNTLVTIDATGSLVQDNTFSGSTSASGYALRVRRGDTDVIDNTLDHTSGGNSRGILVQNPTGDSSFSGNTLLGGSGNEVVLGLTPGNDSLSGGAGTDTVVYAGSASISATDAGWRVSATGQGSDSLTGIEIVDDAGAGRTLLVGNGGFASLQQAMAAARDGDTLLVAAGSYAGDVTFDKAVTVRGAFAGVAGSAAARGAGSGAGESTLIGHFDVTASGPVILDGLRFLNDATTTGGGAGNPTLHIHTGAGHLIENAVFFSSVQGGANGVDDRAIFLSPIADGSVTVADNLISGSQVGAFGTASWGRGLWSDGGGVALSVTGNTIQYARTGLNLDMGGTNPSAQVSGNTFHTVGTGVSVGVTAQGLGLSDNAFVNVGTDLNLSNLSTPVTLDAALAISTVTPANAADLLVVLGGTGADSLSGTAGNDQLEGRGGNDVLVGRGGNDRLLGGAGDDVLDGGVGADMLDGGEGNDALFRYSGEGPDTLDGGIGNDSAYIDFRTITANLILDLSSASSANGISLFEGILIRNVENVDFMSGTGNDSIVGTAGNDYLEGGTGSDSLTGGVGNDILVGGQGSDTLKGGTGSDELSGGQGNDSLYSSDDGGPDSLDGGGGSDFVSIDRFSLAVDQMIDLSKASSSTGLVLSDGTFVRNVERVEFLSGSGNDSINGTAGDDILYGRTGNDSLSGAQGNDLLEGGAGADTLEGGAGNDRIVADGTDRVVYQGSRADFLVERLDNGSVRVSDLRSGQPEGVDTIEGAPSFQFGGQIYTLPELLNTAPQIGGVVANQQVVDRETLQPFATLTIADADTPAQSLSLTLGLDAAAKGSFTAASLLASGFVASATPGSYSFAGTAAAAQAAIRQLVFDPSDNRVAVGASETVSFTLTVDDGVAVATQSIDVISNNVNDAPSAPVLSGSSVIENKPAGTVVGTLSASDPDGTPLTYTLVDDAGGRFVLDGTVLKTTGPLDYEAATQHTVHVQVSDGSLTASKSFIISVGDVAGVSLTGTGGNDLISPANPIAGQAPGPEADTLNGGLGADTLVGGGGADVLIGGAGLDTASYASATSVIALDMLDASWVGALGEAKGDSLSGIEVVEGSAFNDTVFGTNLADTLNGNAGADSLFGRDGADRLRGLDGNDTLDGGLGIDTLEGGNGEDVLVYDAADTLIDAGGGFDVLVLDAFQTVDLTAGLADQVSGGGVARGFEGVDFSRLSAGVSFNGSTTANLVIGTGQNDSLFGAAGNDTLDGGAGNDSLRGGVGNDSLIGGAGIDTAVYAGAQANYTVVDLGGGRFQVSDSRNGEGVDLLSGIERVQFSDGLVTLIASSNNSPTAISLSNSSVAENKPAGTLIGSLSSTDPDAGDTASYTLVDDAGGRVALVNGNQLVTTAALDYEALSTLPIRVRVTDSGGLSLDRLLTLAVTNVNEAPTDIALTSTQASSTAAGTVVGALSAVDPDAGDIPLLALLDDAGGRFRIENGQLVVNAALTGASYSVVVQATDPHDAGLSYQESFTITVPGVAGVSVTGTEGADLITATSAPAGQPFATERADTLLGLGGNDTLDGGAGNDSLDGGVGADILVGGAGADQLVGGTGLDTASYAGASAGVKLDMLLASWAEAAGDARGDSFSGIEAIEGSNFDDVFLLTNLDDRASGGGGNDRIEGRDGLDILKGLAGNDTLDGGSGADQLEGGDGNDALIGGSGADKLLGGAGTDRLEGGAGQDTLTGGSGNDSFVFASPGDGGDQITDFVRAQGDKIAVSGAAFGGLSAGSLPADWLVNGSAATDAYGQFVYDTASRELSWDGDGTGAGAAQVLATFTTNVGPLQALDFLIL